MPPSPPVVLLTGASAGIGRATAGLLSASGFRVFGTSRSPDFTQNLPFTMLQLDVRSDESVQECVRAVLDQAGRIDVLINNAGYGLSGAIEETTIAQAQALFETNFFGTVRMVNMVLPLMRRQRSGTIINLSSTTGLVAPPFEGFYAASKYAIEGYSEALRQELKAFNIRVVLVEPGACNTPFARALDSAAQPIADYAAMRRRAAAYFVYLVETGAAPERIAEAILQILRNPAPRLRYPVGNDARIVVLARRLLPEAINEAIIRLTFRLDNRRLFEAPVTALLALLGVGRERPG